MGAVSVIVGSCYSVWFSINFREISIGEKISPAYMATWLLWLIWTTVGLLWSRSEYETNEDSLVTFLYCNIALPLVALVSSTKFGYTNGAIQTLGYVTLWIGLLFSETATHAYGTHAQLSHVIGAALRVLGFFAAFIFIHYYRIELPYGNSPPLKYPELNRYAGQDRSSLVLVGWILLAQGLAVVFFFPFIITSYVFTMKQLSKSIKVNLKKQNILEGRYCSCNKPIPLPTKTEDEPVHTNQPPKEISKSKETIQLPKIKSPSRDKKSYHKKSNSKRESKSVPAISKRSSSNEYDNVVTKPTQTVSTRNRSKHPPMQVQDEYEYSESDEEHTEEDGVYYYDESANYDEYGNVYAYGHEHENGYEYGEYNDGQYEEGYVHDQYEQYADVENQISYDPQEY